MPPMQGSDIEIQRPDGTWLGLMIAVARDDAGNPIEGKPKSLAEILSAQDDELPISKRLIPRIIEDWSGGVGISYNAAPGVYTRTPGYAVPAGKPTQVSIPATYNSLSPIVALAEYGNSLWAAQTGTGVANTGRVMRSVDGGATWTNSLWLTGANEYIRDLIVFGDANGNPVLYASSGNIPDPHGTIDGRMHKFDGTTWTSTPIGHYTLGSISYGRQRMAKVFWVDNEGIGAWRLVVISGSKTISYTIPGGDPMDDSATAWVEGLKIATGINLIRITAARRHIFVSAGDGVFDINELGDSPNLSGYMAQMLTTFNGMSLMYHDGYVYTSLGQGIDRIAVEESGILQESVGQCAPGWGTPAENEWRGWSTEFMTDSGMLVAAIRNMSLNVTGVFWGKDRRALGIESPNPMIWYGPEIVLTDTYQVTAMTTVSSIASSTDDLKFLGAGWGGPDGPMIFTVSLPFSGSPIQDLVAGGQHRYATGDGTGYITPDCYIDLLAEGWDDRASKKFLHEHTVVSRGLSVRDDVDDGFGTKMTFYDRADPVPGSMIWDSSTDVTESPAQTVLPDQVVEGHRIERRIQFYSPQGGATPPKIGVLDGIRTTAWRAVPSFQVLSLSVEYGAGVLDLHNRQDQRDPDDVTAAIIELSSAGRTILRDRRGHRWTAKVEQVHAAEATYHDEPPGKSVQARIEVTLISELV